MRRYIVSYDIADDKRRAHVFRTMKGFGEHIQYSVFRCDLSLVQKGELLIIMTDTIHHEQDQVLVIDLGPAEGRGSRCIESVGIPYRPPVRAAKVF